jgi:hypothetical protein
MARRESVLFLFVVVLVLAAAIPASAQSFRVQCPTTTVTHPSLYTVTNSQNQTVDAEPPYNGPTQFGMVAVNGMTGGYVTPTSNTNGTIKCQQISGGDGQATMGDGTQTYMFSFGPLSGLADIAQGLPGTQYPDVFNNLLSGHRSRQRIQCNSPARRSRHN